MNESVIQFVITGIAGLISIYARGRAKKAQDQVSTLENSVVKSRQEVTENIRRIEQKITVIVQSMPSSEIDEIYKDLIAIRGELISRKEKTNESLVQMAELFRQANRHELAALKLYRLYKSHEKQISDIYKMFETQKKLIG